MTTGLLPHGLEGAVHRGSVSVDSQSYGLVALGVLIILLLEWEALRVTASRTDRRVGIVGVSAPLIVVFVLTVAARLALLVH